MQRTFVHDVDPVDPPKRLKDGLLDEVFGVGHVSDPSRQPPGGPASQPWQTAGDQALQRRVVASSCALEQREGGFALRVAASMEIFIQAKLTLRLGRPMWPACTDQQPPRTDPAQPARTDREGTSHQPHRRNCTYTA